MADIVKKYRERKLLNELKKKKEEELIEIIMEQNKIIEDEISKSINKIELLNQDNVYLIMEESRKSAERILNHLSAVQSRMRWTMPTIFVSSIPIEEMDLEYLKKIIKDKEVQNGK